MTISAHELAEALGVGVVQRRVHLVEQAERRRVQLEDSENTSAIAVSAFSPPERSWIEAVLLAGGLREDLHARVEDLLARDDLRLAVAAAEERREHAAMKWVVDHVERGLPACSRVSRVDAS